jgi:hypothetical protein
MNEEIILRNFNIIRNSCSRARWISEQVYESIYVNLKNASARNDWDQYGVFYNLLKDFEEHRTGFEVSNSCTIFILND